IHAQNVEIPGGRITRGGREDVLRTMARVEEIAEFDRLIVSRDRNTGAAIRLRDVATVEDGVLEPRGVARLNRREAVTLSVQKQSSANLVATADGIHARLETLRGILPAGSELLVRRDSSVFVKQSAAEVQHHLILGGILASLMVLVFMGSLRST